jgi:hypothetical protein
MIRLCENYDQVDAIAALLCHRDTRRTVHYTELNSRRLAPVRER